MAKKLKVLELSDYIYLEEVHAYKRNKTGFGMIIPEILESLIKENEMYLFTYVFNSKKLNRKLKREFKYRIVPFSVIYILLNLRISDFLDGLKYLLLFNNTKNLFYICKYFVKQLASGYIKRIIKEIKPDLIHIHSAGLDSLPFIKEAYNSGIPFVLTLHGVYSLDPAIQTPYKKIIERKIVEFVNHTENIITTISTGTRNVLIKNFSIAYPENIIVIPNGIDCEYYEKGYSKEALREKCAIEQNKFVLISTSSLSRRKNQIFVLEALSIMPKEIREKFLYLIIGEGKLKSELIDFIDKNDLSKSARILGYKSKSKLIEYYYLSDLLVIASTTEGFGLSFIEAFSCGLPAITFSDLDAVPDVYSKDSMILVDKREHEEFNKVLLKALDTHFNKEKIKMHAKKFQWKNIDKMYQNVFNKAIDSYKQNIHNVNFDKDFQRFIKR